MKKILMRVIVCYLIFCMGLHVQAVYAEPAGQPITVYVDGKQIKFDVEPMIDNGRTMVPMRFIFEALGAEITWDEATKTVTAVKDSDTLKITINSKTMLKNGNEITLDVPAIVQRGRTLVPVRAVSEGMGAEVSWKADLKQVVIATGDSGTTENPDETKAPENTADKEYSYDELSDADMALLKQSYNNLIRYDFEQRSLPTAVLIDNSEIAKEISQKSDSAGKFAKDVWNKVVISRILEIQIKSESAYNIPANQTAEIEKGYLSIVSKAGLEASGYFDVSFETLENKDVMMLITFKNTDTILACKYIGVAVGQDAEIRYFTAETDPHDKENLYFCEVSTEKRTTLGTVNFGKADFIKAVSKAIIKNIIS